MSELDEKKLAERLKSMGLVDDLVLEDALRVQKEQGIGLIQALLTMGLVTANDISTAVSAIEGISEPPVGEAGVEHGEASGVLEANGEAPAAPSRKPAKAGARAGASLDAYEVDVEALAAIPRGLADEFCLLPLQISPDRILVAMVDADNVFALDAVRDHTGHRVEAVQVQEHELRKAIDHYYASLARERIKLASVSKDLGGSAQEQSATAALMVDRDLLAVLDTAPVVRLVETLVKDAVRVDASDIHVEPREEYVQVRFRVDGRLMTHAHLPKSMQQAVISRIKILADEDIAETRQPQDGRFSVVVDDRAIDLRISTLPTFWGEKAVMRILDKSRVFVSLTQLGFRREMLDDYEKLCRMPQGMVLVTGPTGSGKSTTLYATLHAINDEAKNITTVEDPIEYEIHGVNHTQVNPHVEVTFAKALRHILRQDPDIILVGEIRDLETADMAFRAALTGHLVLSTLHTNDAPSAGTRLVNMGMEPYIIASSVTGVVAQRLVRRICPRCREQVEPTQGELEKLQIAAEQASRIRFHRGRGCQYCRNTGYAGRLALFELMMVNDEIREAITRAANAAELRNIALRTGMKTLKQDGLMKVHHGVTSAAEVASVMFASDVA
jgi:type IV pilus assembly protein PilB